MRSWRQPSARARKARTRNGAESHHNGEHDGDADDVHDGDADDEHDGDADDHQMMVMNMMMIVSVHLFSQQTGT